MFQARDLVTDIGEPDAANKTSFRTGMETMAQEAYRSGAGNILDLLDALRTNVELETQRADLLEDLVHAEVEAAYALGRPQLVGGVP